MFLSSEELFQLTKKKRYSAQETVLEVLGINFKKRPDGSLIVSRQHIEQVFGMREISKQPKLTLPNWSALDA